MGAFRTLLTLSLATASLCQSSLRIQVTKNATHAIPSTLYGYMWEASTICCARAPRSHLEFLAFRISTIDGGLYGELLQNRAFQAVSPHTRDALTGWAVYKNTTLDVTNSTTGVSTALPNSLQVMVPAGSTGPVGFQNTGILYAGIKVQAGWKYTGSFYVKSSSFAGPLTVSLVSSSSGKVYATTTLKGVSSSWKKLSFQFQPTASTANNDNVLRVTVDGASAAGKTLYFGMFSLFPPTYKNRPNGMRLDLAEAMAGTKPRVWRFPGGNNLEGHSIDRRWKWNETIGPLENRPGRFADWGYPNTDGLGLMEYLNWAEDLGAEPILGVWAGLAIGDYADLSTFPVVPEDQIQPYVQEVINEIHFITGDAKTNEWAKLRAKYGRTEPYKLKYIEIGNEDFFGVDTYVKYRWRAFVTGLKAAFPDGGFEYLATSLPDTALTPAYTYLDFHQYNTPEWFIERAVQYDTYPRNGTHLFIGEYAVTSTNASCILGEFSCGRLEYPTLRGAVAEAAYMTGLER
ncbi:hypothetical protein FS749_009690 [Ceratobasidium sp. UAMH 11750]|nr:hypothetical protein FS749_009690 [Ceratobasidium sp. UAMH 11750]